jgi:hypothetical protein
MRLDLWDDPRIVRIARDLGCGRAAAIGACFRLWTLGNNFTVDGSLPSYDSTTIDAMVEIKGFAAIMETIGWLVVGTDGLTIPDFDKWNSQGAKRRLKENQRKAAAKAKARGRRGASHAEHLRPNCAPQTSAPKAGPEERTEEERTEEWRGTVSFAQSTGGAGGESGDEWETVVIEVFDVGVNDATTAVLRARERGARPDDIREIVAYWAEEPERWSHPEAALHRRLMRFTPMMPPDAGWDTPSTEYQAAQKNADARRRHAARMQATLNSRKVSIEERDRCVAEYRDRSQSLADEYLKQIESAS